MSSLSAALADSRSFSSCSAFPQKVTDPVAEETPARRPNLHIQSSCLLGEILPTAALPRIYFPVVMGPVLTENGLPSKTCCTANSMHVILKSVSFGVQLPKNCSVINTFQKTSSFFFASLRSNHQPKRLDNQATHQVPVSLTSNFALRNISLNPSAVCRNLHRRAFLNLS